MITQPATLVAYPVACTLSNLPYCPLMTEMNKIKTNDMDHVVNTNIKYNHVNDVI